MTWTSAALTDAASKGWATPDGLLPIADEHDLRRAIHACARAPKSVRFAYVTHCVRRAQEMGLPAVALYDMCLEDTHKSVRSLLKNFLYTETRHIRDRNGSFLNLGDHVNGQVWDSPDNFQGRIAKIDTEHRRVMVVRGTRERLKPISSSANTDNFWHSADDVWLERKSVTAAAETPLDRAWGRQAALSGTVLDALRADVQSHLSELPADPTPWGDIQQYVEIQDGGPVEQLVAAGKTLEKIGKHVAKVVNGVLIEEGYAADLTVQKALRFKMTSDFQRGAALQNEALRKYSNRTAVPDVNKEDSTYNVFTSAWTAAAASADKETPFTERYGNILNSAFSNVPEDVQARIDKIDTALAVRAKKWGATSAQRIHALRKSQVTLQVLRELGVRFGQPDNAEFPYIRLRPFGESEWTAFRAKEERMPEAPNVGDVVYTWSRPKKDPTAKKQVSEETPHLVKVKVTAVNQSQKGLEISWESETPEAVKTPDKTGVPPSELYLSGKLSPIVAARIEAAHRVIPQNILQTIWDSSGFIQIGTDRARASRSETSLNLEASPSVGSIVHAEFHGLEFAAPWAMTLQWEKLVDSIYEGPVGQRRSRTAPPDQPQKYKIDRLAYLQRYPGFWGNEWGVAADFPEPYVGKLYFGEWSDVYAGGYCACGNYELLSCLAETCLAANPPVTALYAGETDNIYFASREMVWQALQDWFLGFATYTAVRTTPLTNNADLLKYAKDRQEAEKARGMLLPASATLPPDVSKLRMVAHTYDLRVSTYSASDTWTLVVEPNMPTAQEQYLEIRFTRRGDSAVFAEGFFYVDGMSRNIATLSEALGEVKSAGKGQLRYSVEARGRALRTRTGVGAEKELATEYPVAPQTLLDMRAAQVEEAK